MLNQHIPTISLDASTDALAFMFVLSTQSHHDSDSCSHLLMLHEFSYTRSTSERVMALGPSPSQHHVLASRRVESVTGTLGKLNRNHWDDRISSEEHVEMTGLVLKFSNAWILICMSVCVTGVEMYLMDARVSILTSWMRQFKIECVDKKIKRQWQLYTIYT